VEVFTNKAACWVASNNTKKTTQLIRINLKQGQALSRGDESRNSFSFRVRSLSDFLDNHSFLTVSQKSNKAACWRASNNNKGNNANDTYKPERKNRKSTR
jgi:hypothetical protein